MKTEQLVKVLSEVVDALGSVDFSTMSQEEVITLMFESKSLSKSLNGIYDAGRGILMPMTEANRGMLIVSPTARCMVELGSARVSAKKFDSLLIAEGIEPLRVKELKDASKGERPKQFYVELNGKRP